MCGLLGGNQPHWNYQGALQRLHHRGPDARRISCHDNLTLGFTRLAVVDTSSDADQPMSSPDGKVVLAFNGEIYGFRKVRRQLQMLGHAFRTQSDTEVILNGYLEWGENVVDHIDGMFAIAIADFRKQTLLLVRDRAGIKPLYYFHDGQRLAFASELSILPALCHDTRFPHDKTAFYDFLTYGYVPSPKSVYSNVFKVPPASQLSFDLRRNKISNIRTYWNLCTETIQVSTAEAAKETRTRLSESVAQQLVADVPVGCFLSGGIDSSIVVAHATEHQPGLQTFSVGFDDNGRSEARFAKIVAELFKTQHHELIYNQTVSTDRLEALSDLYTEPFADTSAFPTAAISEYARRNVTVALSGDGGDELFGGYRWYARYRKLARLGAGKLPGTPAFFSRLRDRTSAGSFGFRAANAAVLLAADPLVLYAELMGAVSLTARSRFRKILDIDPDYDDYWSFRRFWRAELPLLTRLQYLDFHTYLPDDILTKVDRASMAHSLEVRVPFLSRNLIEFAFSLPEPVRWKNGKLKGLLKHAYQETLPASILQRPKQGFSIPPTQRSDLNSRLRETILSHQFNICPDASCLPFRCNNSFAQGGHSSDADVRGIQQRRA